MCKATSRSFLDVYSEHLRWVCHLALGGTRGQREQRNQFCCSRGSRQEIWGASVQGDQSWRVNVCRGVAAKLPLAKCCIEALRNMFCTCKTFCEVPTLHMIIDMNNIYDPVKCRTKIVPNMGCTTQLMPLDGSQWHKLCSESSSAAAVTLQGCMMNNIMQLCKVTAHAELNALCNSYLPVGLSDW